MPLCECCGHKACYREFSSLAAVASLLWALAACSARLATWWQLWDFHMLRVSVQTWKTVLVPGASPTSNLLDPFACMEQRVSDATTLQSGNILVMSSTASRESGTARTKGKKWRPWSQLANLIVPIVSPQASFVFGIVWRDESEAFSSKLHRRNSRLFFTSDICPFAYPLADFKHLWIEKLHHSIADRAPPKGRFGHKKYNISYCSPAIYCISISEWVERTWSHGELPFSTFRLHQKAFQ